MAHVTASGLLTAQASLTRRPHPAGSWLLRLRSGHCECSPWSQEPGTWDSCYLGRWTGGNTGARFSASVTNLCDNQGPATSAQSALAAGGFGRGRCWWATWPPPAAPGAVASSDAGLGTWRETQPRGLTNTGGDREGGSKGAHRCWAQRPTAPDRLISGHYLSSARRGKSQAHIPQDHWLRGAVRQGCRPCQASKQNDLSIPKILQYKIWGYMYMYS